MQIRSAHTNALACRPTDETAGGSCKTGGLILRRDGNKKAWRFTCWWHLRLVTAHVISSFLSSSFAFNEETAQGKETLLLLLLPSSTHYRQRHFDRKCWWANSCFSSCYRVTIKRKKGKEEWLKNNNVTRHWIRTKDVNVKRHGSQHLDHVNHRYFILLHLHLVLLFVMSSTDERRVAATSAATACTRVSVATLVVLAFINGKICFSFPTTIFSCLTIGGTF